MERTAVASDLVSVLVFVMWNRLKTVYQTQTENEWRRHADELTDIWFVIVSTARVS